MAKIPDVCKKTFCATEYGVTWSTHKKRVIRNASIWKKAMLQI